jgi:photosystem II stability/assembly factor-like uncharacterized protein
MKKFALIFIFIFSLSFPVVSQQPWFIENSGTTNHLNMIKQGYQKFLAAGDNGTLLYSTNNGQNWLSINTGFNYNFNDLLVYTAINYVFCDNGYILKSTNYGNNWMLLNSGITQNINSAVGINSATIFAACDNGIIIKTTNYGATWINNYNAGSTIKSIIKVRNSFYAAGNNGTIVRSSNLGINWTILNTGTVLNFNSITGRLFDSLTVFACGNNGILIKTTNGGLSWQSINTGYNYNFTSVGSPIQSDLIITSTEGTVIRSTDNGLSWFTEFTANSPVNYFDSFLSRAAGNNGLILYRYNSDYWRSFKLMDANNISTVFTNHCEFNRNKFNGNAGFEWPKGSNMFARYASGLWLGAISENDTLVALSDYDYEYYPGYTDNSGNPQGKMDTLNRVYKIIADVNDHDRTSWPNALLGNSDQGAPVYFDNASNSWKPLDFGWQTLFTRFTDGYPESHYLYAGSTAPLKADIKMINYAFSHSGALDNTIITRYTLINRSNKIWNNLYVGLWVDDDLGDAVDDMVACDTNLNLAYTYNGDNNDGVYGSAPPAVGFLLLKGPAVYTGNNNDTSRLCQAFNKVTKVGYKDKKMSVFNWYTNGGVIYGDPQSYYETYRIMKGLNKHGDPIINPQTNQQTTFFYPGDPVTGQGWINGPMVPDDQRFISSFGPLNMNPNDTQVIVFAQIIARGTSNLNSITALRQYAQEVRNYYNNCFSGIPIGIEPVSQNIPDKFELYQNYPNPFNPVTRIQFVIPAKAGIHGDVMMKIYNSLGQLIETQNIASVQPGTYEVEFDGSNLSSGVYFYSLVVGNELIQTRKMILLK